jgi:hypothetical protein
VVDLIRRYAAKTAGELGHGSVPASQSPDVGGTLEGDFYVLVFILLNKRALRCYSCKKRFYANSANSNWLPQRSPFAD